MAALSAGSPMPHRGDPVIRELPAVGADTFYDGAIVVYDLSTGFIQAPVGGSADHFAGIVVEETTTTAQGDRVKVATGGEWLVPYDTPVQGDEGDLLYRDISANSDNPADLLQESAAASADIAIGRIVEFVSATEGGWVRLGDHNDADTKA